MKLDYSALHFETPLPNEAKTAIVDLKNGYAACINKTLTFLDPNDFTFRKGLRLVVRQYKNGCLGKRLIEKWTEQKRECELAVRFIKKASDYQDGNIGIQKFESDFDKWAELKINEYTAYNCLCCGKKKRF